MLYHSRAPEITRNMSAFRNSFRTRWWLQNAALSVLCAMLVGGQVSETAHAEVDCEHESCSLCVGSSANDALVGDPESPSASYCVLRIAAPESNHFHPSFPTLTRSIRGPPSP